MVPALSLLLALAAPPGAADRPSPALPWLDAAGATPRWNQPLSLRLRLHPPAGDERPLPHHCLSPTLHYGAWALPPGQLRWRVDTDPAERRSWLSLESPLPVTEPWIDVAVDWHCGALEHRQSLTLLVEPDWPGDAPMDAAAGAAPGTRRLIATRIDDEGSAGTPWPMPAGAASTPATASAASPTTAAPRLLRPEPAEAAWQAVLSRLARLESGAARPSGPEADRRHVPAGQAQTAAAAAPTAAVSTATSFPTSAAAPPETPSAASAAIGPVAAARAEPAATPRARPPRHVADEVGHQALAAWPWMLLCAGLGWAWGRRPRDPAAGQAAARGRGPLAAGPRPPAPRASPSARALPAWTGGAGSGGPWPAWFGAPTRPDAGAWLAGGLPRPEAVPGVTPSARAPDDPGPWNRGLSLTEVEVDAVVWAPTPADGPAGPETTTAASAAVS